MSFGFDEWGARVGVVVQVLLLAVSKSSYIFEISDVVTQLTDPNVSLSWTVSRLFPHGGRSACAEMSAAVVRASQASIAQPKKFLILSRVKVCVGNYEAIKEGYISKW